MKNYCLLPARSLMCVKIGHVAFVFVCLTAAAANVFAQQPAPAPKVAAATDIDVKAIDALKSMGAYCAPSRRSDFDRRRRPMKCARHFSLGYNGGKDLRTSKAGILEP